MSEEKGLIGFLDTNTHQSDLRAALRVIEEFKRCESTAELVSSRLGAWVRLEQLEDYLRLLTGEGEKYVKDERAKLYMKKLKGDI